MNPIIPWNAATYFAEPEKWEIVMSGGSLQSEAPTMYWDGALKLPHLYEGMRRKVTKRKVKVFVACSPMSDGIRVSNGISRDALEEELRHFPGSSPIQSLTFEVSDD